MASLQLPDRIYHLKTPNWPQFRFEWHPGTKKIYIIRVGVKPEIGEAFAHEITTEGAAWNATLIWLRGYREARSEMKNVQDQRLAG